VTVSSVNGRRQNASRSADLALAALVVLALVTMVVPLPTWVLDVLLAGNLSAAVAILLVVLYVPDAIGVAAFPTVLLLTTLVRLSLEVAATRLVLSRADAGEVIRAFGSFVVGGNYVVGAVVFLILTIIQFVVIARGGERVAEVGARFVLDAMPGKQMAIDAELRSGAIDLAEARRRRAALGRESQFYGAMDGAMKFVKGDVVASLLIVVVNIVGGLAIGVLQRGMPVADALKRYGLLTIGEGLVTQIPALVLSTAAGVLVTRVASEEPSTPLGQDLFRQLLGVPRALLVAAVFVLGLALVPGLPAAPFLAVAAALLIAWRVRSRGAPGAAERLAAERAAAEASRVPVVVPWGVEVGEALAPSLDALRKELDALGSSLFTELGVPFPAPAVAVSAEIPPRCAVLALHEVPAVVLDTAAPDAIVERARALLRARAADFLGVAETQKLLDALDSAAPGTVKNVVPKPVPLTLLAEILRRLVDERVSVRDLRAVLEPLATAAAAEKDPLALTEHVRAHLRRAITWQLTRGEKHVDVFLLDSLLEDTVRRGITRRETGAFLALSPAAARDVVAAVRHAIGEAKDRPEGAPTVLLTQPDVRRFVKKLLETDLPDAVVVSHAELLPEIAVHVAGRAIPA
jgi:type III secretion protein V